MRKQNKMNYFKVAFIIFALLNASLVSIASAETNLVANPGYESGSTTPLSWSLVTSNGNIPSWDKVSHSGARSVRIQITGTSDIRSGYPKSDLIAAQPATTYTLSAWGKSQGAGGTVNPVVRVVELDANKNSLRQTNLDFSRGTYDWTQKQKDFQTSSNTAYIYVYANIWGGYGTFWVDDVVLSLKNAPAPTPASTPIPQITPTPAPTGTNLVKNPGYESGTTSPSNWAFVTQNGNTPVWDIGSHSGSRSIKLYIPGTTDVKSGYPKSDLIQVQASADYTFSVWGKTLNAGGTSQPAVRVVQLDANKNSLLITNVLFSQGTNAWTQKQIDFRTRSNTAYIYIYANIWGGYGTFWMDDVALSLKGAPTPTPAPTSALLFDGYYSPTDARTGDGIGFDPFGLYDYWSCLQRTDSLVVVSAPGGRTGYVGKFNVNPGDGNICGGGTATERAEVGKLITDHYDLWYGMSTMLPSDFRFGNTWHLFFQTVTKGYTGRPDMSLYFDSGGRVFLGMHPDGSTVVDQQILSYIKPGIWHDWIVHIVWTQSDNGLVEVYHREAGQTTYTKLVTKVGRTANGNPLSIQTKNGLYRKSISYSQTLYSSGFKMGTTMADVEYKG